MWIKKNEVATSEPVIGNPKDPAETERVDKQVGQDKALTIVEKTNIPQAPQGTGDQASPAARQEHLLQQQDKP